MSLILSIIIIFGCVLGEAFFSGSEIALVSADRIHLRHAAKSGHRGSRRALEMLKHPEWILGMTLLGTNVCTITSTTVSAALFYRLIGPGGIPISIVVMSFINWIFAEIVPKSVFHQLSNQITPTIALILRGLTLVLFPVIWFFSGIASLLVRWFGGNRNDMGTPLMSREELRLLMKMKEDKGDVKPTEKRMINRLLYFTETEVQDIMVPLIDVAALSDRATVKEGVERFVVTKHRRLPVFRDRVDRIIGILNSFDILGENPRKAVKSFVRQALYVPPTMNITDLLEQLQTTGENMVIVIDEFGGAEGIVTIEDILEEVVGEIEDEYDKAAPLYDVRQDGSIAVNARISVDEVNELFGLKLPMGDYETLGGFIIDRMKRIPRAGERIRIPAGEMIIQKATRKVILEVIIKKSAEE